MAIGYACQLIGTEGTGLSRCTLKNATEENLRHIILGNLKALDAMIDYNIENEIRLFRISSDLIPFGSHPVNCICWWEDYREEFHKIGQKIKESGMRVSMHPGQYTVLNSKNEKTVENAVNDLWYHYRLLDALQTQLSSKIILHIGGVYGDKTAAVKTFYDQYRLLPAEIKDRLVIENDDKNYTVRDVLLISEMTGAPVVFDNLHHELNPSGAEVPEADWINQCSRTWNNRDGLPKIHYSQQKEGGLPGAHSDTVFLDKFLMFYNKIGNRDIDIMLEVKDKNLSAVKCNLAVNGAGSKDRIHKEWKKYRYYVLSKSPQIFHQIDALFGQNSKIKAADFFERIDQARILPEDKEAEVHAARLLWNGIRAECTKTEENRFERLIENYEKEEGGIQPVKNHLLKSIKLKNREDLSSSLYFYL